MARETLRRSPPEPAVSFAPVVIDHSALDTLLEVLQASGYRTIGPVLRDGVIVYGDVSSAAQMPRGWTDEQEAGRYRLVSREDGALFGYAVGPHSWKQFLYPPELTLWRAKRQGAEVTFAAEPHESGPVAFIGVRACELNAIRVQDRVLAGGAYTDPEYARRREQSFIVAVNCSDPAATCFCLSMGTGPRVDTGYDLCLTELVGEEQHEFLVEAGSQRGVEMLAHIPSRAIEPFDQLQAERVIDGAEERMGREMPAVDLKSLLYRNHDHPRWDDLASRCLSCANCTMVCPTCFCSTVEEANDLTAEESARVRRWDSCFTVDFSYIHGGSVRSSPRSRYRQWMTHKLASWVDQFGTSGCVGCGRCITWCPAGIDITEEARAIAGNDLYPAGAEEFHGHA